MRTHQTQDSSTADGSHNLRDTDGSVKQTEISTHVTISLQSIGNKGERHRQHGSPTGTNHQEKSQGTDYAHTHYYGAWWFILIWAVLAALGAFYIIKRKVKCASTLALHLSFIIILAGALLTHISAKRGMIHLRIGQPTDTYMAQDEEQGMKEEKLPFSLCLQKFEAKMHDGTNAVADYSSKFTVIDGDDKSELNGR